MTDKHILRRAAYIARSMYAGYLEYQAECDEYQRQGYRAHYCEHGANRWTDYDNICGGCEDGWSAGNGIDRRHAALTAARNEVREIARMENDVQEFADLLREHGVSIDNYPGIKWQVERLALLKKDHATV